LISIGIAELVVPAILIAVITAAGLIAARWVWEMNARLVQPLRWAVDSAHTAVMNRSARVIATVVVIVIATFAVAGSVATVDGAPLVEGGPPQEPRTWIVLLAGLGTLSLLVLVAAAVDKAFTSWDPRWEWKVALVAVVIALVLAPVRIAADLQTRPLPAVLVCMTDPRSPGGTEARLKRGLLIGETSDRVYVGEPARTHQIGSAERQAYSTDTNRIASVPWTHIQKLYIARNPPGDTCAPAAQPE
jgi:hypothetical protein